MADTFRGAPVDGQEAAADRRLHPQESIAPLMVTATTTPTVQCPGCGAKIPSTVSICPYCVTPLQSTGAKAPAKDRSPVLERLAKMKEKPGFAEGMAFEPIEGPSFLRASRRGRRAMALTAVGVVLLGNGLASGGGSTPLLRVRVLVGIAMLLYGGFAWWKSSSRQRELVSRPLIRRPARVSDRRSETTIRGARGQTVYFFELEFEDGTRAEFQYPGRGASENPLTSGVTGIAYTRGQELIAFKRIRV